MPHKKAKRSVREAQRALQKSDNPPATSNAGQNDMPKNMARVLNAAKIRSEWKAKKRSAEDTGENREGPRKKTKLTIQPGESLGHFNRRVEDDMRSTVRSATKTSNAVVRKALREDGTRKKKKKQTETTPAKSPEPEPKSTTTTKDEPIKEFATYTTSAPKRLNDIAQAPPEIKFKPRQGKLQPGDGKHTGVLSMAQKKMMEEERERAIKRYRELKASRAERTERGKEGDA